jgi:NAD(P)-dependent dehydrogenase (short-subunit alcohol dehydrogenase family)
MHVLQLNVTDEAQIQSAFELIEETLNDEKIVLHALINNAGIGRAAPIEYGNFDTTFGDILNINLNAPVRLSRAALPLIRNSRRNQPDMAGDARIINICSQAGVFHLSPLTAYCCSKSALIAFTNCLRQEVDRFNVRAISIEPTFFATPIVSQEASRNNLPIVLQTTRPEVLETYGAAFTKQRMLAVHPQIVSKKVHLVIDSIVEATLACQPEMRYTVAEPLAKIALVFGSLLPVELIYIATKIGFSLINATLLFASKGKYEAKVQKFHNTKVPSKSN